MALFNNPLRMLGSNLKPKNPLEDLLRLIAPQALMRDSGQNMVEGMTGGNNLMDPNMEMSPDSLPSMPGGQELRTLQDYFEPTLISDKAPATPLGKTNPFALPGVGPELPERPAEPAAPTAPTVSATTPEEDYFGEQPVKTARHSGKQYPGEQPAQPVQTQPATAQPPVQTGAPVAGFSRQQIRDAIAGIESAGSGDYAAVGPTHPKLGRALGRYQIMEANIGPWSQATFGERITPQEFMADPAKQDAIFDNIFGGYVSRYGLENAAQAWFAGPGGIGTNRKDSLGTGVPQYGKKFMAALGRTPDAGGGSAVAKGTGGTPTSPSSVLADIANQPDDPTTQDETAAGSGGGAGMEQAQASAEETPAQPVVDEGPALIAEAMQRHNAKLEVQKKLTAARKQRIRDAIQLRRQA